MFCNTYFKPITGGFTLAQPILNFPALSEDCTLPLNEDGPGPPDVTVLQGLPQPASLIPKQDAKKLSHFALYSLLRTAPETSPRLIMSRTTWQAVQSYAEFLLCKDKHEQATLPPAIPRTFPSSVAAACGDPYNEPPRHHPHTPHTPQDS